MGSSRVLCSGVTLVLIEVMFFAHSTIIFGVVGAFLILASLFWAMVDRYPDQPVMPIDQNVARADVEPLDRDHCLDDCDRIARALFAADEFLSPFRIAGGESLGPILQRAARIRHRSVHFTWSKRDSGDDAASQWKRKIRRSTRRCRHRGRIYFRGNSDRRFAARRNAGPGIAQANFFLRNPSPHKSGAGILPFANSTARDDADEFDLCRRRAARGNSTPHDATPIRCAQLTTLPGSDLTRAPAREIVARLPRTAVHRSR